MRDPLRVRARELRTNLTDAERFAWYRLRKKQFAGHRFRRQHPVAGYIVDFVCLEARLVLELDGGQHAEQKEYDAIRTQRLEELGFRVLRFWNNEILTEWDSVEAAIIRALEGASVSPPPCPPPAKPGGG